MRKEPRPAGVKKLKGEENLWRIRVAKDYRVVYHIFDDVLTIEIVDADHRSRIYRS
ncbi:MAG: type II toxin-antitoxin system RelE family toxin [Pseudonocardiaceae bacterium]